MDGVWIRLNNGWTPATKGGSGFGWALWQPNYVASPWPYDDLEPEFAYYVCEDIKAGGRGITARAVVTDVLPPTEVASAQEAYQTVAEHLFDASFTIAEDDWHANGYNAIKSNANWPQFVTAWRSVTEPVGPHVLDELGRFPRTGWLWTDKIALPTEGALTAVR